MSPAARDSAEARSQVCEHAAEICEAVHLFEDVITRQADRARVAKSLEHAGHVLFLAAARFHKSPKAAEVLRVLQSKHPLTNHN